MLIEAKDCRISMSSPLNRLSQKPQNEADFLDLNMDVTPWNYQ